MWTIWKLCFFINIFGMVLAIPSIIECEGFGFIGFGFNLILFSIFYSLHREFVNKHCVSKKDLKKKDDW
jgi:hypothetical protein